MAVTRQFIGIERIDFLEMRRRSIETSAVDYQVAIPADLDPLTANGDQTFDIELILRQIIDPFGFENNDFTASRWREVISKPIHEEMVSGIYLESHDVLAHVKMLSQLQPGACFKAAGRRRTEIGRKPDRVRLTS